MKKMFVNDIMMNIPSGKNEMIRIFSEYLTDSSKHVVKFINPEIFLMAEKDPFIKNYFLNSESTFIDGFGLLLLINTKMNTKYTIDNRFPGTDLFTYLPSNRSIKVFLLGAIKRNNDLAVIEIQKKFHNVQIVGNLDGYSGLSDDDTVRIINESQAELLVVCLGSPKQEYWIERNKDRLNTKVITGNGGSIDFWSNDKKRAPAFFINHGMEWLYRLFQDFTLKRIRRQMVLFPFFLRIKFGKFDTKFARN